MEEMDRISELPEPILFHILSFLPFKQVAQTAVLSKTWERTWRRYPILEFDGDILTRALFKRFHGKEKGKDVQKKRKRLCNCLEEALRNRYCREMINIDKFTIDMNFLDHPEFISFVERCICFAVGSNVKELTLKFVYRSKRVFKLPQIVLCSGSIELLTLRSCTLEYLPRSNIQLSSLKKLFLWHVFADDHMIASLVSGCPMIEDLHFHLCSGFKSLKLSGLSRLNEVRITENTELQQLHMEALNVHLLDIFWASATAKCQISAAYCENIKNLSLNGISLKENWISNFISQFPLLEVLSIFDCFELQSFKVSSPCLKELCLSGCWQLFELQIDAPKLHVFTYFGNLISLSLNALVLSKVDLEIKHSGVDTQWSAKYIEFLAKFRPFPRVLYLQGTLGENISVPRNLRMKLPSPLSNIKHLNSGSREAHKIAKVVDDLLWISPHTETVSIKYGYHNKSSFEFQFSYRKQLTYQGPFVSCCKSHPISCWQHCMKEVKLEINIENDCEGKKVKSYILKGANIMQQIDALCGADVS